MSYDGQCAECRWPHHAGDGWACKNCGKPWQADAIADSVRDSLAKPEPAERQSLGFKVERSLSPERRKLRDRVFALLDEHGCMSGVDGIRTIRDHDVSLDVVPDAQLMPVVLAYLFLLNVRGE